MRARDVEPFRALRRVLTVALGQVGSGPDGTARVPLLTRGHAVAERFLYCLSRFSVKEFLNRTRVFRAGG
jgi:hypothetical protein